MTRRAVGVLIVLLSCALGSACARAQVIRGANVVQTPHSPFGSDAARLSLQQLQRLGANTVAIIPFLWQATPGATQVERGNAVTDAQLVAGIRAAHGLGLKVMLKPHIWVPGTWAGAITMSAEGDWPRWFESYSTHVLQLAELAQSERVAFFVVGTELRGTVSQAQWLPLISAVRARYSGHITFVADNLEEAQRVPFWDALDFIALSSYPALGDDTATAALVRRMDAYVAAVGEFSRAHPRKPVWVAELGMRSATDAPRAPWESAEERAAPADERLQARILGLWLDRLQPPLISAVLLWRWFTDPLAGGPADTDFTVQHKVAEGVLRERWRTPR